MAKCVNYLSSILGSNGILCSFGAHPSVTLMHLVSCFIARISTSLSSPSKNATSISGRACPRQVSGTILRETNGKTCITSAALFLKSFCMSLLMPLELPEHFIYGRLQLVLNLLYRASPEQHLATVGPYVQAQMAFYVDLSRFHRSPNPILVHL